MAYKPLKHSCNTRTQTKRSAGGAEESSDCVCSLLNAKMDSFAGIIQDGVRFTKRIALNSLLHSALCAQRTLENCALLMCANEESALQTIHLINNRVRCLLQSAEAEMEWIGNFAACLLSGLHTCTTGCGRSFHSQRTGSAHLAIWD
jgi:hypothetical protein